MEILHNVTLKAMTHAVVELVGVETLLDIVSVRNVSITGNQVS